MLETEKQAVFLSLFLFAHFSSAHFRSLTLLTRSNLLIQSLTVRGTACSLPKITYSTCILIIKFSIQPPAISTTIPENIETAV